ncbi:uncharacterized protein LOC132729469 [Ruditapes philippinarum]|uniref:uncharacterized protein LOC132729469 n=1 Tax=Ruditapes philippinarum TaxID=129788 RepID=UPI00295A6FC7|nr:uncharacterized protein LOC132729469 [Ruditapes philippinarum]XP_060571221.1 uncharacterized protein LOC132729469 [Ruditapes philippinarum]
MYYVTLFVLSACAMSAYAATVPPPANVTTSNIRRCRQCNRASTLSDCNKLVTCDSTLEDCFMDELITDQLTVVYVGGCRAKTVCNSSGKKRRNDLVACSRCCDFDEDCNKRLCGIKDDTLNSSQCYSCDHRTSEQSEVKDPKTCVTLDTCQPNEVCYATTTDIGGKDTFYYGCLSKLQCGFLMEKAYKDFQDCVSNKTALAPGPARDAVCGNVGRATSLCHSCCADGGCNYGTCEELNNRIFALAENGKFDIKTLKTT